MKRTLDSLSPLALAVALAAPTAASRTAPPPAAGVERALSAYAAGDFPTAAAEVRKALAGRENAPALALKGLGLLREGRLKLAREAFERALVLDPRLSIAHEGMGRLLLRGKRPEDAVRRLRRAVELDNCNWRAMYFLAAANSEAGRWKAAVMMLREAATLVPESSPFAAMIWFQLGLANAHLERWYLAARAYQRSIDLDPTRIEAWNNLAILLIESEQYNEAERLLEEALRFHYGNANLEYLLGTAYYRENTESEGGSQENGRAFEHLRRARDLGYDGQGLWVALAWSALGTREYDIAEDGFKRMLAAGIDRPEAQKGLGYVHLRRRDLGRARQYFERAARDLPRDTRLLVGLASVLIEEERLEEAVAKLDEALAIDPESHDALYKKGTTLMKLGRKEEARQALARFEALQDRKDQDKTRSRRTREALLKVQDATEAGRWDEVIAVLEPAVAENPDGRNAALQLANAYIESGQAARALPLLEKLKETAPKLPGVHALLALAHDALGNREAAEAARRAARTAKYERRKQSAAAGGNGTGPEGTPAPGAAPPAR